MHNIEQRILITIHTTYNMRSSTYELEDQDIILIMTYNLFIVVLPE